MTLPAPPPGPPPKGWRRLVFADSAAVRTALALVVTAVWVVSLIVRVISPSLDREFTTVDAVVVLVFGAIFGVGAIRKNGLTK